MGLQRRTATLLVVCLAAWASALPVDPRNKASDHLDEAEKLRRARMPDTPGLDQEEYNRYWEEMVKENPGRYHGK